MNLIFTERVFRVKWPKLSAATTALILIYSGFCAGGTAQNSSNISHWFSESEMKNLGLNTLSLEQQRALSDWISARVGTVELQTKEALKNDSEFIKSASATPNRIESNIVGEVTGWDGSAIFELTNGQIWRQRGTERSRRRLSNPAVVIEKNFLGFYIMSLPATGQKVRVKRIR